jgi:hypothetical protein
MPKWLLYEMKLKLQDHKNTKRPFENPVRIKDSIEYRGIYNHSLHLWSSDCAWRAQKQLFLRFPTTSNYYYYPSIFLILSRLSVALAPWFLHLARLELSIPFLVSHSAIILLPPLFPLQRFLLYASLPSMLRFLARDKGRRRDRAPLRTCRPLKAPHQF